MNFDMLERVRSQIAKGALSSGRANDQVMLVAVSKQKPIEDIQQAWHAGVRHFGENRTTELAEKAQELSQPGVVWHFIGHLQSRYSQVVAQYAHYFHAVDRLRIARRLSSQLMAADRELKVFVQVNVSGEMSKGGFACEHWKQDKAQLQALLDAVREILALPRLHVQGLMTMAPRQATETQCREVFASTRELLAELNKNIPELNASGLSMGMSNDFLAAIEEGSTCVRVGSAIFGERS